MEKQPLKFTFCGENVQVDSLKLVDYRNGGTACLAKVNWMSAVDGGANEPVQDTVISIRLEPETDELTRDQFFCKHYSELEELYNALVKAGWLKPIDVTARTGFVTVPACIIGDNAIVFDERKTPATIDT